jgi:hypothetical protein
MTTTALLLSLLGSVTSPTATADAPRGWEVTRLPDRSLSWAAPRGWKLAHELPAGLTPSSLSFEKKAKGRSEGWLTVEALVSGNGSAEQVLSRRPTKLTNVTTQDGWTCGEEAESGAGADIVCARTTELVTTVIELGGGSGRMLADIGGVEALRQAAGLIQGVWPKGLPQPDATGHLPAVEWVAASAQDGHGAWMAPKGWTATGDAATAGAPPTMMSFNAVAGTGFFSITALPGLGTVSPEQAPVAEERVVKFLVADAALTHEGGWTCGEGREKSSGLPAIVCNHLTHDESLYVSVRAEPAVFQTLGGVAAVRAAAEHVRGF